MSYAIPIGLLTLSFALAIIEVFIPSFGALAIMSLSSLVGAIWFGFQEGPVLGWTLAGTAAVGMPTLLVMSFKIFPKTKLGKHMILSAPESHPEPATRSDRTDLVGKEGVARSALRPSGTAEFDGERLDVVTRGELVDTGTRIRIIENRGNRIVVRAVDSPPSEAETEQERLR
ncbi:MAG: NfeD family protein [Planctomycetota bacterium]